MSHAAADRYAWTEPAVEDLGGGIYRIPLPLPLDGLKAVNVYAITDPGGVDLIDAGMAIVAARERLTEALRQLGYGLGDVRNFLVTHIHIDHYSLAVRAAARVPHADLARRGRARQHDGDQGDDQRHSYATGCSVRRACAGWERRS